MVKGKVQKSPLNIFYKLQAQLADLIASTAPGDRLPSEPDLAKSLGVSRATLREAMRTFEGQGVIRRRQGVGTFVVSQAQVIDSGLEMLVSIETLARRIGLDVSMGVLSVQPMVANEEEAGLLGVEPDSNLVRVSRVILAETRPVAYLVDILAAETLTADELKVGFTGSVLDFLLTRGTPKLTNSYAEVRSVAAPTEVARLLEIQRGDVLLMFDARLYSIEGRVVDHSTSYFLPGYFRFHVVRKVEAGRVNI
jgi:GntR family transcriptional regulator